MSAPLRPMSTSEVLDRTFNLYRNHFLLFTGISTVQVICMFVGVLLVFVVATAPARTMDSASAGVVVLVATAYALVIALFYLIGYALGTGATIYAVSNLYLGYAAGIGPSYREMRPLMWRTIRIVLTLFLRVLGAMLLTEVVVGVLLAMISAATGGFRPVGVAAVTPGLLSLLAFITAAVWAARIVCRYSLAVPACLLEKLPARQALMRSRWLTRGSLARVFLVFLLMGILALGLYYALEILVLLLAQAHPGPAVTVLEWAGLFMAMALAFPIGTIAVCLIYYDQRVRKEAFDLQLMMGAIGEPTQSTTTL